MISHIFSFQGNRKQNEDCVVFKSSTYSKIIRCSEFSEMVETGGEDFLAAVIDGMGGHPGGDVAAKAVADELDRFNFINGNLDLDDLLQNIQNHLNTIAATRPELKFMGATVILVVKSENTLKYAWAGDCRLYHRQTNKKWQLLTRDHNVGNAPENSGRNLENRTARQLTRALMPREQHSTAPEIAEYSTVGLAGSDMIFLSSDGVWECLPEYLPPELPFEQIIDQTLRSIQLCAEPDNYSGILVKIT